MCSSFGKNLFWKYSFLEFLVLNLNVFKNIREIIHFQKKPIRNETPCDFFIQFIFVQSHSFIHSDYGVMPGVPFSKAWLDYAVIEEVIFELVLWQAFKELCYFTICKPCPRQSGRPHLLKSFSRCWINFLSQANPVKERLWKKPELEQLHCWEKCICNIWHHWPHYNLSRWVCSLKSYLKLEANHY